MASGNGNLELRLRIQADLKSAQTALSQLETSLNTTTRSGNQLGQSGNAAASGLGSVGRAADNASQRLAKTGDSIDRIDGQLNRLKTIAGAVTGLALGGGIAAGLAHTADEYTNLAARIRLVSTSNEQAGTTFKSVIAVANETGQRIASTAELYTRMARSLKGSATQTELLQVTSVINKAAIVSGATAEESSNAIIQLSQGLASGTLRGEEFNSVAEQMPRIMEMLQTSLGKTRGELRAMAEQGLLTTDVVFKALKDGAADIDREFSQMPLTIGRAATEMANAWVEFVGGTNDALGASKAIASVISGLAGNLSTLATAAIALSVVMGGRKVAALISATQAARADRIETLQLAEAEYAESKAALEAAQAQAIRAKTGITVPGARAKAEDAVTAALVRQTAAEKALNVARASSSTFGRLGSGLMGLFGGPLGLALTGMTLAVGGLSAAYASAKESEAALAQQHQQTIQTLEDQRQKTESLIDAQGRLKASASTGDALTQQRSNADVLTQDSKKLSDLQGQAAMLKQQIDGLMSSPEPSGLGVMYLAKRLEEVQKQIDELTPKFDNLKTVQGTLSDELENRLARAMDAPTASGKTLRDVLAELQNAGPIRWMDEAAAQMEKSEQSFAELSAEADKLKPKLEKELADATMTAVQQLEQLRDKTIAAALAAGQAPADIDKLRESLEKLINLQKQTDQAKENKRQSESAARTAKSAAQSSETYVKGLEKQAWAVGKTKAQVSAYELAEKGLSGALKARAEAALAVIAADEQKEKADGNATRNAQLQAQYLKATGDVLGGGLAEVRANIAEMRSEFTKSGNTEGLAWLDRLLPVQEARVRADALKKNIDDLEAYRSQKESSVQAQVQAGLISELQGRRQLVALHQEIGDKITGYLPQLRQMATLPGETGDQMRELLSSLENELLTLKSTTDDLTAAFKDGLQDGMESTLNGLANGTLNLSDAVMNLAKTVVNAMAQVASRNLAGAAMEGLSGVTDSVKGLLGMGTKAATSAAGTAVSSATSTAADAAGATAGATTYATAITTASTAGATAMGTSITAGSTAMTTGFTAAFTSGVTAMTTALSASFAAGAATLASAIASASAASSASSGIGAAAVAAATGGHITGPGTATSDSITARLSNGEFVVRSAAVQHYGVDFLHSLNQGRLGMYAEGGLVSDPGFTRHTGVNQSPAAGNEAEASAGGAAPVLQQYLVLDPNEALNKAMKSAPGNRIMMTWVKSNSATLKQVLGVK